MRGSLMRRMLVPSFMLLVVLTTPSAPYVALADPSPFCNLDAAPTFDQAFAGLATILGDRVGGPTECSHAEQPSGDLQQATSAGLFYLRKSTNIATFTDGAEHWALRGTQSLHWTTSEVDPPSTSEVSTLSSTVSQPTSAPSNGNGAASAAASPSSSPGTSIAVLVVAVGLLLCVGMALMLQRQRRRAYPGVGKGAQLVAAEATAPAGGPGAGIAQYAPAV